MQTRDPQQNSMSLPIIITTAIGILFIEWILFPEMIGLLLFLDGLFIVIFSLYLIFKPATSEEIKINTSYRTKQSVARTAETNQKSNVTSDTLAKCPQCGFAVAKDDIFCMNCGTRLRN